MLKFKMLRQQHSFSTDEWMSFRSSQFFCGRNKWLQWGGRLGASEPPTSCQMLYHLKFELSKPVAFYLMFLILRVVKNIYRVFICGVNIQNDTCALATALYFWLVMNGCSWEIVNFLWRKMSHARGFLPRTLGFMPNALRFEVDSDLSLTLCQTE